MILITGASGNVGKEVLKQAVAAGLQVRAAFQSSQKAAEAPPEGEAVIMDYNQPETVRAALRGVDRVFLVGPVTSTLVELESKVVDEIRQSEVRHIVKLSAMGPRSVTFPRQHHESEDHIKASGVGYTFLRPNGFMQNLVIYNAGTIQKQSAFYGSQGDGLVSQIDLRDIAMAAARTLADDTHLGKTYTLTGPEALSNARMAEILSESLGRKITYVDLPPDQLKQALVAAGTPDWNANGILELNELYRSGGASTVSSHIEQILGRKPTDFVQFSKDYAGRL